MTRRLFLGVVPSAVAQPRDTPRNAFAKAGNEFMDSFRAWAEVFNRVKAGTIDAGEITAWEPMPSQFRKMERLRRDWMRGE